MKKTAALLVTALFLPLLTFASETHNVSCNANNRKDQRHRLKVERSDTIVLHAITKLPFNYMTWLPLEYGILSQYRNKGRLQTFNIPASRIEGDAHRFVFEYKRQVFQDLLGHDEDGVLSRCIIEVSVE